MPQCNQVASGQGRHAFLLCADNRYVPHAGTCLFSLLLSTPQRNFDIHVILNQVSEEKKQVFERLGDIFGVNVIIGDGADALSRLRSMKADYLSHKHPHLTETAMLRLFYDRIVEQRYDRIAYIDCDTIVKKDATVLLTQNIGDHILGAVPDVFAEMNEGDERVYPYFNSGVLLINDQRWRSESIGNQLDSILQDSDPQELPCLDQDVLNLLFARLGYCVLPYTFNFQYQARLSSIFSPPGVNLDDARIIHYTGDLKPWLEWAPQAYSCYYEHYRHASPWGQGYQPEKPRTKRHLIIGFLALVSQGRHEEACAYAVSLLKVLQII